MRVKIKNYHDWMEIKSKINNNAPIRAFKEGEIWWGAVGENVGVEIDGKSGKYSRPILIFKKHSNLFFTGIPLTSRSHSGSWYAEFEFQGKTEFAVLVQARSMDVTRLYERMGEISRGDYRKISEKYFDLFYGKNVPQS